MTFQERITKAFNDEQARRASSGEPRLTRTDLWKAAGLSSGAATHWFNGTNGADLHVCQKIAPILRCDPNWLFSGEKPRGLINTPIDQLPKISPPKMDPIVKEIADIASQLSIKGQLELYREANSLLLKYPVEESLRKSSA